MRSVRSPRVSGGLGPHQSVVEPRLVVPCGRANVCGSDVFFVSISWRARTSLRAIHFWYSHVVSGFTLHRALPISSGFWRDKPIAFPFYCFCDRPDLASARRHSSEGSGELGRLPCFQGAQRVHWDLAGLRGARPDGDPGPFDRCLQLTDSVFKNDRPHVSAHSASHVPTRHGSHRFTPMISLRRAGCRSTERFLLRNRRYRRTSDTSSLRGLPQWNASVHRVGPPDTAMSPLQRVHRVAPESLGLRYRSA